MPSRVTGGPAAAMKAGAMPQAFSTGIEVAEMNSPHTLALGNSLFSTSATRQPSAANSRAAVAPAGPEPITTASYSTGLLRDEEMGEGKMTTFGQNPAPASGPEG